MDGICRLFCIVAVFISFLRQVEVRPLGNINFGIDYDTGNPFNTKTTEPRVQTRLCLAEGEGFEPPEAFTSTVFKTAAIGRSANLP